MNAPSAPPVVTSATRADRHTTDQSTFVRAQAARFAYADVQDAIDQIYDLRVKVIRINLLGTLLHRPDPVVQTPPEQKNELQKFLSAQTKEFAQVTNLLSKGTPIEGTDPNICRWMQACCADIPDALKIVQQISSMSEKIADGAAAGGAKQSGLLSEHMRAARAGIMAAISNLCEHLWADYESYRTDELTQSRNAAESLNKRLSRLERIGSHVRLVSLNASVEASRVGDAGRGLTIIAQEFKTLAEEVKKIAQDARGDVSQMIGH